MFISFHFTSLQLNDTDKALDLITYSYTQASKLLKYKQAFILYKT